MEENNKINKKENIFKKIINIFKSFTLFEKIWLFGLIGLSVLLAILFPDDETSHYWLLLTCSFVSIISNLLCELLISKRSKWNFIISLVFIETSELIICLILKYYVTVAGLILFWIPIDIISFFNWEKHKDKNDEKLTQVRKLTIKQDILLILAIAVFTVVFGYLFQLIGGEESFLDACATALGFCNGVFILLRFREQWIAWIACILCEAVLWILAHQWIMLTLTLGYLINSTYGYIMWTRSIKNSKEINQATANTNALN